MTATSLINGATAIRARPQTRPERTETSLPVLGSSAAALLWVAIAWIFHDEHYELDGIVASAGLLGGAIGFYLWRPHPSLESVRFIGLTVFAQLFINSGLSVIHGPGRLSFVPSPGAFSFAVEASLTVAVVFTGAVGATLHLLQRRFSDPIARPVHDSVAIVLAVGNATSILASLMSSSFGKLGTLPVFIFSGSLVVPLLVASRLLCNKTLWLPLGICFFGQVVVLLYTSSVGTVGLFGVTVVATYIYLRRPLPWLLILATAALVLLLNPAKHAFRNVLAKESAERTTAIAFGSGERAFEVWTDSLQSTWGADSDRQQIDQNLAQTSSRFDYNWASALVYSAVPAALPHEAGATYLDIPLVMVPRVLYPEKPTGVDYFRTRWTAKLGMQSWASAQRTAVAIPIAAEAYWNFGWFGVVIIPAIVGVIFAGVLLCAPNQPVGRAAYIVFVSTVSQSLLDMLVWLVPTLAAFVLCSILVRVYTMNMRATTA